MTEPDTDADDEQTDDQFEADATLNSREPFSDDPDSSPLSLDDIQGDASGPPDACASCGTQDADLSPEGFCPDCQAREGGDA